MSTALVALPKNGDVQKWSDTERALVEAAGLVSRGNLAPRPVVEAFLLQCQKTQLDPIARQIYCIERGGKWTTQISIDGARLVAERSKQYQGQTPVEWTADGVQWMEVWLSPTPPAAARVGVYRAGFQAPLYAVATWDAYNAGSPIWKKMPALMLGKCAEMLALRKAFPQDLSGLYSSEEMSQADTPREPAPTQQAPAQPEPVEAEVVQIASQNWAGNILDVETLEDLKDVFDMVEEAAELGLQLDPEHAKYLDEVVKHFDLSAPPAGVTVGGLIGAVKRALEARPVDAEPEPEDEPVEGEPVAEWATAQIPSGDES